MEDRSPGGNGSMISGTTPADFILSCVARATCQSFQEHIIAIQKLTTNSTKQLYVDIGEYLQLNKFPGFNPYVDFVS